MIDVDGVSFRYRNQNDPAIANLSFSCESSGVTALVGGSGVGKSTLMALLAGIYLQGDTTVATYEGRIRIDGREPKQLRGPATVSWVPQQPILLDHLDIVGNILLPTRIVPDFDDASDRCKSLLAQLRLEEVAACRARELSGGMKTRVSLARALITRPKYLFLDEPFSSLDLGNRWNLYTFLRESRQPPELTTVITTHNIPEAMLIADRVAMMKEAYGQTTVTVRESQPPMAAVPARMLGEARRVAASIEAALFLS